MKNKIISGKKKFSIKLLLHETLGEQCPHKSPLMTILRLSGSRRISESLTFTSVYSLMRPVILLGAVYVTGLFPRLCFSCLKWNPKTQGLPPNGFEQENPKLFLFESTPTYPYSVFTALFQPTIGAPNWLRTCFFIRFSTSVFCVPSKHGSFFATERERDMKQKRKH